MKLSSYKASVLGVQCFIFSVPIGVHVLRPQTHFLFPPLGDADGFLIGVGFCIVGLFTIMPWVWKKTQSPWLDSIAIVATFAFGIWYGVLVQKYVVGVPVQSQGKIVYLSVGSVKSLNAQKYFPNAKAREMLHDRGPREEEVRWLYTDESIDSARDQLLLSYISFLAAANLSVGFLALRKARQEHSSNALSNPASAP
ncbi:hypothetical protein [Terriglobus roseus]|uniref:Uncharacterized protein n=1 Tax=Terriglobus roseus TaxID=392734 RepID=A0A1G7MZT0_9BACT|nr:hypothetical protein [Terriglobus roseus]SDF67181.1 hypothetical protein SAMN05444167_2957 [Terriglobus roseus]